MKHKVTSAEWKHRSEIVRFGKMLHEQNLVSGTDGNLSVRLAAGLFLTTPKGISKGQMRIEDLVVVDQNGKKVSGTREPSSELGMHLTIYALRPEINAVVHAHPTTATGFASAGIALTEPICSEIIIALGEVPLAPYGTPGTPKLSQCLMPFIKGHDAVLMANHGVVTYGVDLARAYSNMEAVEHFAKVVLVTRQLGSPQMLDEEDRRELLQARIRYHGILVPALS